MVECKCGCKQEITIVPGKVQKQFYSDACRKAYKRAELKESKAVATPSVAEPRTVGTKQPRTLTPDKSTSDILKRKTLDEITKAESHVDASDVGAVKTLHRLIKALPIEPERTDQGNIRVSKPGDSDYEPQCETTRAFIEGRDKQPEVGKRGKDIKVFEDLSPGVQKTIVTMAMVDGHIDKTVKANRTAIAINYQHNNEDYERNYHSTGV